MNGTWKWFLAEGVFLATVRAQESEVRSVRESLLFLVQASDHESAVSKAENIARAKEHSYENEKGEQVQWTFSRLVEVTEAVDQQFADGAELKSTMIDLNPEPS